MHMYQTYYSTVMYCTVPTVLYSIQQVSVTREIRISVSVSVSVTMGNKKARKQHDKYM